MAEPERKPDELIAYLRQLIENLDGLSEQIGLAASALIVTIDDVERLLSERQANE